MENIGALNTEKLAAHFRLSLASVRAAEDLYDRTDRPEAEAAQVLRGALDAANAAAEAVLAQSATNLTELKLKTSALLFRWRASDFDATQFEDDAELAGQYGEGALAAFTDLAADIEAMA